MRRLALVALACGLASPAFAQDAHGGHAVHANSAPAGDQTTGHAGMDHSAMDHGEMDHGQAQDADVDHSMHMGHAMEPERAADDTPGDAPPPPVPTDRAADAFFPPAAMERSLAAMYREMTFRTFALQIDQLEYRARSGQDGYGFEGSAWYGGDIDRAVVDFEGEGAFGEKPENIEVSAYWRRALDPWFNLQLGVRHDFRPDPDRTYAMAGIQGLAPYWFEVEGQVFISNKGDVHARLVAAYDQRITQRLILEPELEADFAFQDVPELGIASGFEKIEASARLRYEVTRMFAPYVGVFWERRLGGSADHVRAHGERASAVSAVAGIRIWF
ncbi:copper resistance protein B [Novosphingobium endophyticum]|uniref:Copper resistance protein B n=1 Tax=Novosphingobium endophyticum TaxID=1955250 RepID=A0A916TQ71_9SPHN|nr:copper resistance protein B [Novosphingobium endophyticum]GGB92833.1 copper resistance protein B [Novosphingobium endophyticum]